MCGGVPGFSEAENRPLADQLVRAAGRLFEFRISLRFHGCQRARRFEAGPQQRRLRGGIVAAGRRCLLARRVAEELLEPLNDRVARLLMALAELPCRGAAALPRRRFQNGRKVGRSGSVEVLLLRL